MSLLLKIWDWSGRRVAAHYGEDELVAFNDGESSVRSATRIAAHLDRCAQCRRTAAQLKSELGRFSETNTPFSHDDTGVNEGLHALRSAIRDWNMANQTGSAPGSLGVRGMAVLTPQLRAGLGVYLGLGATDVIFEKFIRTACSQKKIAESVEVILRDFLGRQAGEALVRSLLPLACLKPIPHQGAI